MTGIPARNVIQRGCHTRSMPSELVDIRCGACHGAEPEPAGRRCLCAVRWVVCWAPEARTSYPAERDRQRPPVLASLQAAGAAQLGLESEAAIRSITGPVPSSSICGTSPPRAAASRRRAHRARLPSRSHRARRPRHLRHPLRRVPPATPQNLPRSMAAICASSVAGTAAFGALDEGDGSTQLRSDRDRIDVDRLPLVAVLRLIGPD